MDESLDESLDENLDEYLDESLDENLDETNVRDETINDTSILKLILEKLGIEKQITNNNNDNENTIKDDEKNNKKLFYGPYQPNYGTQINIDHLNLILDPSMLDKVSFLKVCTFRHKNGHFHEKDQKAGREFSYCNLDYFFPPFFLFLVG